MTIHPIFKAKDSFLGRHVVNLAKFRENDTAREAVVVELGVRFFVKKTWKKKTFLVFWLLSMLLKAAALSHIMQMKSANRILHVPKNKSAMECQKDPPPCQI